MKQKKAVFLLLLFFAFPVFATEYSSTSYKVIDPVIDDSAGVSTSASYRLVSTLGDLASGRATSTSFTVLSGGTAFATATTPTLSVTAGSEQVTLSWTSSQGSLGWTVSSYDVCTGTVANTYTCETAGNVLTFVKTGLTAGTTYYFRVRAKDAFGNVIVRSAEATAVPTAASQSAGGGSSFASGGGGGSTGGPTFPTSNVAPPVPIPAPLPARNLGSEQLTPSLPPEQPQGGRLASVVFRGRAYPGVTVSLLQNGIVVKRVVAASDATFTGTISDLASGIYTFGAVAEDKDHRMSILLTFTFNIPEHVTAVTIDGIFLPPTIDLSSESVKRGEVLSIFGQAYPGSAVTIRVNSEAVINQVVTADKIGAWLFKLDTKPLAEGTHLARAKASVKRQESTFGEVRTFEVASAPLAGRAKCKGSDLNFDGRVGFGDISILLFYWNEHSPKNVCTDLNFDGAVDLLDFSILLYNWTG